MRNKTPFTSVLFGRTLALIWVGLFVVLTAGATLMAFTSQKTEAAESTTINFQARLMRANGALVPDGNYNVEFKLYGQASGGSALWTETYYDSNGPSAGNDNRTRVANGYLTVNLGSQTAFPGSINWDQELWLTMNVGGRDHTDSPDWDGEMQPRLKLTAVPYAFSAGQLQQTNGGNTSTLGWDTQTGARSILLPDAGGTVCLQNAVACGFVTGSAADFIQNGTDPQTANFNITGSATAGSLITGSVDASTSGILDIGGEGTDTLLLGAGTAQTIIIDDASSSVSLNVTSGGETASLQVGVSGVTVAHTDDSTTALQVTTAAEVAVFTVDTENTRVIIGEDDADATLFVLDSSSDTDPAEAPDGSMYYNTTMNEFRCRINGAWANCGGTSGGNNFMQGGNSFGQTAVLGTDDEYGLDLITNNNVVASFSNTGEATFQNSEDSESAFRILNAGGEGILNLDTLENELTIGSIMPVSHATVEGTSPGSGFRTDTFNIGLPDDLDVGDLLLVYGWHRFGAETTFPAGWTRIVDQYGGNDTARMAVAYKISDGTETNVTVDVDDASWYQSIAYRISGHDPNFLPEAVSANGTGTTASPPAISPSWGDASTLTFSFVGTRAGVNEPSYPCADNQRFVDQSSNFSSMVCSSDTSGSTISPDPFSLSSSVDWAAATVAVPPGISYHRVDTQMYGDLTVTSGGITIQGGNLDVAGMAVFQGVSDNVGAFKVLNTAGDSMFNIDTLNNIVSVGNGGEDTVLFALDTKDTDGDPDGVDGAMYYNSHMKEFRCYIDGSWANCGGISGGDNFQQGGNSFGESAVLGTADSYGLDIMTDGNVVASFSATGELLLQNSADSTTALQVQNASGSSLLTADTVNNRVKFGDVRPDSILSEYGFDEGSGATTEDLTGNAYDLTARDSTDSWSTNAHSGAGSANGPSFSGELGPDDDLEQFTLMMQVYIHDTPGSYYQLVADDLEREFYLEIGGSGGTRNVDFFYGGDGPVSFGQIPVEQWTHVALTFDEGTATIYIDGGDNATWTTGTATTMNFGGDPLWIGSFDSGTGQALNGQIDDLRLFDVALSQSEVQYWMGVPAGQAFQVDVEIGGNLEVTGNAVFRSAADTTSAFLIQNATGVNLLTADTQNMQVVVGSLTDGVVLSATGFTLTGDARHARSIVLTPEYAGAVLDDLGSVNTVGFMTARYDSTERMNYYHWSTAEASAQEYSVVVTVQVPSDWDAWAGGGTAVCVDVYSSDVGAATAAMTVLDTDGDTDVSGQSVTPNSDDTWSNTCFALSSSDYEANGTMTIQLTLSAEDGEFIQLGNLTLNYLSRY